MILGVRLPPDPDIGDDRSINHQFPRISSSLNKKNSQINYYLIFLMITHRHYFAPYTQPGICVAPTTLNTAADSHV
ncbi:hypothetical protein VN97_g317 [Penicillium thymicola]|uniref:Uncharacterized protein n=1 Tax=Penicillium thymicola TaxID=293382 RepID=A0AAI9TT59_PENTH|nr:hypothetical protein VN97_g317 [Penicillium thymicola]